MEAIAVLGRLSAAPPRTTAARLIAIGCAPLSPWRVWVYQRMQVVLHDDLDLRFMISVLALAVWALPVYAAFLFGGHHYGFLAAKVVGVIFGLPFAAVVISAWCIGHTHWVRGPLPGQFWRFEEVWRDLIPVSAQRRAQAVAAEFGTAVHFEREHLQEDPFLVAVIGGRRYHIAVWNERGLELA